MAYQGLEPENRGGCGAAAIMGVIAFLFLEIPLLIGDPPPMPDRSWWHDVPFLLPTLMIMITTFFVSRTIVRYRHRAAKSPRDGSRQLGDGMVTGILIPGSIIAFCILFVVTKCDDHHRPVRIENDTIQRAWIDVTRHKILPAYASELPHLALLSGGRRTGGEYCSKEFEFAYLSTDAHRKFAAYRVKDFCDPDECACVIKVSDLEKRRNDLSVPWEQAGM